MKSKENKLTLFLQTVICVDINMGKLANIFAVQLLKTKAEDSNRMVLISH